MKKLYLLSVVTQQDLQLFILNLAKTIKLNKENSFTWIIVCNGVESQFVQFKLALEKVMLRNAGIVECVMFVIDLSTPPTETMLFKSAEHGMGINYGVKNAKLTDGILIIIDPDFIFTKLNWLKLLLRISEEKSSKILGTPWDPSLLKDWGDFPAPHLMIMSTQTALEADFTPKNKRRVKFSGNDTFGLFGYVNQRIETGSKLYSNLQIVKSSLLKFRLLILLTIYRQFPQSRTINESYLLKSARRIQISSGSIFEHSYSVRAKKALQKFSEFKYWFLSPELTFRYLVLLRSRVLHVNAPELFFRTPLEFLNFQGEIIAVHARSVGSNYTSYESIKKYLDVID